MVYPLQHVLLASLMYFAIAVGTAIILDTVRRGTLEPWYGKMVAVLVELPLLLAVCWRASLWSTQKFAVSPLWTNRLVMSCLAFTFFVLVELAMSVLALGRTWEEFCKDYAASYSFEKPADLLGRFGEGLYGAMPLLQVYMQQHERSGRRKVKP